jgi:hypothetical protein
MTFTRSSYEALLCGTRPVYTDPSLYVGMVGSPKACLQACVAYRLADWIPSPPSQWAAPAVRGLCSQWRYARLPPIIFSGMIRARSSHHPTRRSGRDAAAKRARSGGTMMDGPTTRSGVSHDTSAGEWLAHTVYATVSACASNHTATSRGESRSTSHFTGQEAKGS